MPINAICEGLFLMSIILRAEPIHVFVTRSDIFIVEV